MKFNFRETCPIQLFPFLSVLDAFSDNNFLVGGGVRDLLTGKEPNDYDLVTDIPMDTLIMLFEDGGFSVSKTGVSHLVLNVSLNYIVEISNFRKDTSCDGRHAVVEIGTIEEDAHRRDFTVNALYINTKTHEVVDPTGMGLDDLQNRILRFVGKPKDRITEDALRVIRFYRFVSKGFNPDPKSLKACREMFNEAYDRLAPERVRVEIEKIAKI
jgi:tRNA nucleotidyltransferase/poly(A) polymerase